MGWKCDSMGWIGRSMGCFQPIDGMFLAEIADEMALICHAGCAKRPLTVFSLRPRGGPLGGCGGSVRSISRVDACRNFLENCPRRSLRRAGQTVGDDGGRQGRFAARVSSFSKKTGGGGGVSAEILNFVSVNENHARVPAYARTVLTLLTTHTMEGFSLFVTVVVVVGVIVVLSVFFYFVPFFLWLSAKVSGVHISLIQLFLMRIRNVPPGVIVPSLIEAHKAGLSTITRDNLEAHYMTGGHVQRVVHALVSASKAGIELSFEKATAIDLAGRDVFEAVQTSVNPKVIDTPPVAAVAKNGIQLIAKARVTVRANIHQLVGGAGEDTILARVGEGIVSSIGSAASHEEVLENPDSISKLVLRKGLDAGTAFEILSIDIADIDVGKNIGATLQMDQANADKNIAQAKAEERRAMAVALEQEMKAKAQQARAEVIQAEAEVPKALAQALREGNMGFMDFYRLENLKGDTAMRENFSKFGKDDVKDILK